MKVAMLNEVIKHQHNSRAPSRVRAWVMAARPKTLTAGVVPIIVATALVKSQGWPVMWWISVCALLSSIFIQIGTNFVNDAIDFKKGADSETRIGPQRVTQSGLFTARQVLILAGVCFVIATAFGIPLVLQGGWPILLIGLASLALGYAYTGGPFPLAYLGLGDIFVILFFGVIAVTGTYYLHTSMVSWSAVVAGLQIGLLATVLIAVNNLRDAPEDALVNKKTLVVRFGINFARFEIIFLICAAMVLGVYWWQTGHPRAAILPLLTFPVARRLVVGVVREPPSPIYNRFLAMAALVHLIFGLALSFALAM